MKDQDQGDIEWINGGKAITYYPNSIWIIKNSKRSKNKVDIDKVSTFTVKVKTTNKESK